MDLVIEAKIILLMFVWPTGQMEDQPLWTDGIHPTLESCEQDALERKAKIGMEYGPDVQVAHYCFDAADRIVQ